MKRFSSQKISLGEKVGYSLGDAAANLVFQMMMIFQLKFYTDVDDDFPVEVLYGRIRTGWRCGR